MNFGKTYPDMKNYIKAATLAELGVWIMYKHFLKKTHYVKDLEKAEY